MRWTVVLAAIVACGKSEPPPPAPPAPRDEAKPPPPVTMTPGGDTGTCTVKVHGATAFEETMPATGQSKFWSDASHSPSGFVVNCNGTRLRLSLVSGPNTMVDFKAKDYEVHGRNPDVLLHGRVDKPLQDFVGSIKITTFDSQHLAGDIDVTSKTSDGGPIVIWGSFDVKASH